MICSLATSEFLNTNPPHFHAVIDSDVFTFTGPKPASFPFVPPKTTHLKPSPREATMPNFFVPGWVTSSFPFMGFAPSSNPFKCDFLRCLDFSAQALPIVGDADCGYSLKPSLKTDWDSLERNLRVFLRACMKVNGVGVPDDLRLWSFPLQYGYSQTHTTLDDARAAAYRSRQAFIPLIASVSFFLHLLYHMQNKWVTLIATDIRVSLPKSNPFWSTRQNAEAERRHGPVPSKWDWQERLQKETFISTEWLSYFYEIMEIPMVGVFMDVHNSGCLPWLNIFLETKMPVVLYWGSVQNWRIPRELSTALPFPTGVMVKSLISKQSPYSPIEPVLDNTQSSSTRTRQLRLPRIDGGTQPRRNESIFEFLKRRASDKARAIATESAKDRQSRLQREEHASKDMPPGRKGARVYYWDLVEGVRVRNPVGRSNYEDIWERYGPRQRCYDAVADEWDICTELDPNDEPSFGDDDEDDDDDYFITHNP
ncbi:MAG: hypothetical protein NXY57DRAFT_965537 [Lentinula lateritia]|nr:MAG: hypothetical protein NXY57DRAFT_965537 [Lentinula lateritia]